MMNFETFKKQFDERTKHLTSADVVRELEELGIEFDDIIDPIEKTKVNSLASYGNNTYSQNGEDNYNLAA